MTSQSDPPERRDDGAFHRMPPEVVAHVVSFLDRADHASCRLASPLFCIDNGVDLAARTYAQRPNDLAASSTAPVDAIAAAFARWGRRPDMGTIAAVSTRNRADTVRWALDAVESHVRAALACIDSADSHATRETERPARAVDARLLRADGCAGLVRALTDAISAGSVAVVNVLVGESWLLARPRTCLQEADILADAIATAPLEGVAAAVDAFCRRGWDQPPSAVLGVAVFYAMSARRTDVATWLHARPEIRRRDGRCACERVSGERAFRTCRVDWLSWLDDVQCRGRYRVGDDTVPLAVRTADADLVRWAVAAGRAAGIDIGVHDTTLAKAMRDGAYKALCALDETGVAPFASWPSLLLGVANACIGLAEVRHIYNRGGPYNVEVLARAACGGRTDVLDYLLAEDGPATEEDATAVAGDLGRLLTPEGRGWRWESGARGLQWLRDRGYAPPAAAQDTSAR
ncbi:F-box domain-containing protein [Pandoravirus kuranda]|uniref:F-box domain-containing protein n=1 Tax=Pandoravirus kuranda TaxID=3019033 RepID=A0AA95EHN5_9VIRU|nr:F-box domain-containing protein [Pandoravirus kuranda]